MSRAMKNRARFIAKHGLAALGGRPANGPRSAAALAKLEEKLAESTAALAQMNAELLEHLAALPTRVSVVITESDMKRRKPGWPKGRPRKPPMEEKQHGDTGGP